MPVSRNQIKFVKSLQQKKFRSSSGCFVVEGIKPIQELLQSDFTVVELYATIENMDKFDCPNLEQVPPQDMSRMSGFSSAPGALAVVRQKDVEHKDYSGLTVILDGIGDPGNMGTIIRTAEWFGANQIIASPDCVDFWSPKVVQSAMGSLFRIPCLVLENSALRANLSTHKVYVMAADMGGTPISKIVRQKNQALVIGSESQGLSKFWREGCDEVVSIPGKGDTESLNAAVAASILLYAIAGS